MASTYGEGVYGNGVGVTTPLSHKMAQVTEFVKTSTANLIRPGVLYNGNASLVTGRANMAYDVAPFSIVTTRGASSGAVKWTNDGTVTVSTTAAPGSNSRIDVIYAWHREFSIDGVDSNPVIGVVQGTAAASPTVPSLAAFPGAVELARVIVPAGVTATNSGTTFTQTAPFTTTDGGTVPFRTVAELNGWTTAITGQMARDLSTGTVFRWNGSAWRNASAGLSKVVPTASSGTISSTGAVTASGVASVSVDWDSTEFENYLIAYDSTTGTASEITLQLRAAGSTIVTANYNSTRNEWTPAPANNLVVQNGATSFGVGRIGNGGVGGSFELHNMASARKTRLLKAQTFDDDNYTRNHTGAFQLTTAVSGIVLAVTAGTFSPTVRIYGFNS